MSFQPGYFHRRQIATRVHAPLTLVKGEIGSAVRSEARNEHLGTRPSPSDRFVLNPPPICSNSITRVK